MTRTDEDSWDLASSVGATATMVAAARAVASNDANPIINDPFAAPWCARSGLISSAAWSTANSPTTADGGERDLQLETDSIAVRTRFFDDFFLNAARDGVRQSVILAAGLDARAYRLSWPSGSVVYEVDQPQVIEFKTTTMSGLGAAPAAERRTVSIDLREDWPAALRSSGFDVTQPTAWSAEGLLMYLPPEAQDRLFDNITELSATGSQLATEYHPESDTTMIGTRKAVQRPMVQHRLRHRPVQPVLRRRPQQCRRLPDRSRLAGAQPATARTVRRLRPHFPERRFAGSTAQHRRCDRNAWIGALP